ncbi:MAG: DUF5050 domain-containing protein [Ruminococcaceae bacterium]|nr:DUF5050 domain-containing protein [Oscillospiraceae bacterium]
MQIDLLCPVENQGTIVKTNSQTGKPYALLRLFNLSDRVVEAIALKLYGYDDEGNEIGAFSVDIGDVNGQPKEYFASARMIPLGQLPGVTQIETEFLEIHFTEGDPYIKEDNKTEITMSDVPDEEKNNLQAAAGEDALYYAKEEEAYWLCVCGRPNVVDAENCVRCGRDKSCVLNAYHSAESVAETLVKIEEETRIREEAEKQAKLAEKKARNRKILRFISMGLGGVIAAAILCVLVYLAYGGVMTLLGNSAAKKGDFLTAYTRYATTGNSGKIAQVSEEVRGNSTCNLMQKGLMTADDENLYFIDPSYTIYKENKTTGEKEKISETMGIFLNVSDGWLYYLNASTGQAIHRVSTDGATEEVVYESEDGYFGNLALVGNELFFVLQEPIKDLTPEMQESLAQTGGSSYQTRLYRLPIGKKTPKLVSDQDITIFANYEDRIYYLDQTESALYSMDRHGKDVKKLISGPVYSFNVMNDAIYYADASADVNAIGLPKMILSVAELDGTFRETLVDDGMIISFGPEEEDLYYINYNTDGMFQLHKRSGETDTVVAENCQLFNQADGYTLYVMGTGQFMKTTYDKNGYEEITVATAENTTQADSSGTETAE